MFSKRTFDFLSENRLRNSREWFDEHRGEYEDAVLAPMRGLVEALTPTLLEIDPQLIVTPRIDRTISRIRRDTRFSHDKSLYRDVVWCVFLRDKKLWNGPPGFVVELSPRGWRYGCGYYQADPKVMDAARGLILERNRVFLEAFKRYRSQDIFHLEDNAYKRSRFPSEPPEMQEWLNQKSFWVVHESEDWDLLCSDRLIPTLCEHFRLLSPIYRFFWLAETSAVRPG